MKVVADTNVLISATFWCGDSDEILSKAECGELVLVLSKEILKEYASVLQYKEIKDKIKAKNLETLRTIQKIISIATIVNPLCKLDVVKDDPDDNKIIECAIEGEVDYIITQDKHLLKLKRFENIDIVTPKEFLDLFKAY